MSTLVYVYKAAEPSTEYTDFDAYSDRDWSSFDLDEFDRNTIHTYREPEALYYLYVHEDWTQGEVASRFNVSRSTISRWLSHHGIEKSSHGVYFNADARGHTEYGQITIRDGDRLRHLRHHRFLALLENPLHEVLKNEVHHKLPAPVAIDIPDNLEVVSPEEHRRIHREGDLATSLEEIGIGYTR